ncbi:MAG: tetratricopeptide (TPR) repeat protein [Chlamydiales bacterium]|jgi:tetratricopeptide (TPR) repeat protein
MLALTHTLMLLAFALQGGNVPDQGALADVPDPAADAYRAGDYETAQVTWLAAIQSASSRAERARLAYNLGNTAFRADNVPEAVGWYTSSLALVPRDADAWASLELARTEAGLEPADRGDLRATLRRVVTSVTLAESEWIVLWCVGLLALCLTGEALRGGVWWRRAALATLALCALVSIPWGWNMLAQGRHPMLVVADGTAARSEPRPDAKRLRELAIGAEVERLDDLPGWVQVRDDRGERLWVRSHALFDLIQ